MPLPGMTVKDYVDSGGVIPNDTPNVPMGLLPSVISNDAGMFGGQYLPNRGSRSPVYGGSFGRPSPFGGGIASLLGIFSQMSPEQFDSGMKRYEQFNSRFGQQQPMNKPLMSGNSQMDLSSNRIGGNMRPVMKPATVDASGQVVLGGPASQPTMTSVDNAEGGFGTGSNPYTQPYYSRSFGQNTQAPGYYNRSFGQPSMGSQPPPYMPTRGGLYGQTQSPYGNTSYSSGKGGSTRPYSSGAGKGGYF